MPSPATDTDAFPATIQRPNNGELADSASLAQGFNPLTQRTRHLYNRARAGLFDVTRAPYNADPTGVASSQAAFDAAIAAATAVGGDVVIGKAGTYLYTGLTIPQNVNVYAVPGVYLAMNHATANAVVFTDSNDGPPSVVRGIRFIGNVVNTGTGVVNNADARGVFERCTWNGFDSGGGPSNNLQGKIALVNSAASKLAFVDCDLKLVGDVIGLHALNGLIEVSGGSLVMPATYNQNLVRVEGTSRVSMVGVGVDCTARSAGGGVAVALADAAAAVSQIGCRFDATGASGVIYSCLWSTGARVLTRANDWIGNIVPYAGNVAELGSSIELKPMFAAFTSGASYTLPDGYAAILLESNNTSGTDIVLPAGLFPGQLLHFTYFNSSASAVLWVFASTPVTGTVPPTIGAGNTLTGIFAWEELLGGGSFRWVQKGAWGVGTTLV